MDIKIGFSDNPRELAITVSNSQEEVQQKVAEALGQESGTLQLNDDRGRTYLIRASRISYVEIGASHARPVGFVG